jgi:hypothetical protein
MPNTTVGLYEWQLRIQFEHAYGALMLFYPKVISRRILTNLGVPSDVAAKICRGNVYGKGTHYSKVELIPEEILRAIASFLEALSEAQRADVDLGNRKKGTQPKGKGVYYP